MPLHQLTESQEKAFEDISNWIYDKESIFKALVGFAGVGKTYLLNKIVQKHKQNKNIIVTATTNKAVKVLRDLIDHDKMSTIHSLLNIKAYQEKDKEYFKPDKYGKGDINAYDLVIVDECSMVSSELLDIIKDQLDGTTKVLFVGDPAQLQPINENISKTFDYGNIVLSEIVRYDDDLAKKAELVRKAEKTPLNYRRELIDEKSVKSITIKELKEKFKNFRDNPNHFRLGCWRNDKRQMWNKYLRACDYGFNPEERFVKGDYVIAIDTCFAGEEILLNNSEEAYIVDIDELENSFMLRLNKVFDGEKVVVNVAKEEYVPILNNKLSELAKEAKEKRDNSLWKEFWQMKKAFHNVDFAYAMTTHKAQGSTFDNMVIDVNDYNLNRDILNRNQLMYVGMTRASDNVYLL